MVIFADLGRNDRQFRARHLSLAEVVEQVSDDGAVFLFFLQHFKYEFIQVWRVGGYRLRGFIADAVQECRH